MKIRIRFWPRALLRFWRRSIVLRLLSLVLVFMMGGVMLALIPALANFREAWLKERLAVAHIAALALEAVPGDQISDQLEKEFLQDAGLFSIAVEREGVRYLVLRAPQVPSVARGLELEAGGLGQRIGDAFDSLTAPPGRVVRILGRPPDRLQRQIEIVLDERSLQQAMITYGQTLLSLALIASILAAVLLFGAMHWLLVRPLEHLSANMSAFRSNPEDARRVLAPGVRADEIGDVQRALASLQNKLRGALHQKTRLAALGTAVSKIHHDLRNMLFSAQLISERLTDSADPMVRRLAPRFFSAIDRATRLCSETMNYGRGDDITPKPEHISLRALIEQVGESVDLPEGGAIRWINEVPPGMKITIDPDHLFRALLNLGRNAVQALEKIAQAPEADAHPGQITIRAGQDELRNWIEIQDTGRGLSKRARDNLFKPFAGSDRREGFGLGMAIASELIAAQGGELSLVETGAQGTLFRAILPIAAAGGQVQAAQ